jgi:glyoxylase-like metal-dependent hydrolase (beta-lactamase superfamily II)
VGFAGIVLGPRVHHGERAGQRGAHHRDHRGRSLATIGKSLDDVRALILMHGDTDHIGFAARPHRETRIAAHIHKADIDRARLTVKKPNSGWGPVKIGPLAGFLWYSARRGGLRIRPATELKTVADNEVLDVPGSPRIIQAQDRTVLTWLGVAVGQEAGGSSGVG